VEIGGVDGRRGKLTRAMAPKRPESSTTDQAKRIRAAGERANAAAQRAAVHLSRAAAALRAQGYGSPPRRGR
jgi:hypothetical protein